MGDFDEDDAFFETGRKIFVRAKEPFLAESPVDFEPSDFLLGGHEDQSFGLGLEFGISDDPDFDPADLVASADVLPLALMQPVDDGEGLSSSDYLKEARSNRMSWGIAAVAADRTPRTGAGVTVAVLDTGISDHPAFTGLDIEIEQRDFTRYIIDPKTKRKVYPDDGKATDNHGHGTHCAGTIFGQDVDSVRIGVARGIKKAMIGKVLGPKATTEDLIAGIEWAIDGNADIISMSLNFDLFRVYSYLHRKKKIDEVSAFWDVMNRHDNTMAVLNSLLPFFEARAKTQMGRASAPLIIAAAGNQSNRPHYSVLKLSPSTAKGIVAVGAIGRIDSGHAVASFSNIGPHFVAPGVGIVSAGLHIGPLQSMNGTSMACPHVAGLAALHWEELAEERGAENVTAEMVKGRLLASAMGSDAVAGLSTKDVGEGMPIAPLLRGGSQTQEKEKENGTRNHADE